MCPVSGPGLPGSRLRLDEPRFLRLRGKLAGNEQHERAHYDPHGYPPLSLGVGRKSIFVTLVEVVVAVARSLARVAIC